MTETEGTTAGSYFVSNYPPYSFWGPEHVGEVFATFDRPPAPDTPLGIYLHIPFCRKRCHFCYFKVYTDKNHAEVEGYLDTLIQELTLYSKKAFIGGRKPRFIYFGGGTPSYISSHQLSTLVERMKRLLPWDEAEEVAFECEPGTLTEGKLRVIRDLGVTRLSLGIENFDDEILKINGRAHTSKEIEPSYRYARSIGFPQINIDLISGMVGETPDNWRECVRKTIALDPDSVTIYQMEIPYNTTIFKEMRVMGQSVAPVATWKTKREWVGYAFSELERAGYTVRSAYTAVKNPTKTRFIYTDLLWSGADMIGLGVASFSHVQGSHFQNEHEWGPYTSKLNEGKLPIYRAFTLTDEQRLIRELILQMKLGHVHEAYFREKFGIRIQERFADPLNQLRQQGYLKTDSDGVRLSREGLLQVDRLLQEFFLPEHRLALTA
ncbi:MAG TPA: coproporphyrinogen-III oxidase family protein [Bryobacteraceae bacterium]|nr:coproporphyrinogen-III oxidase family protein [Bryobacteraceae bacterium]